MNKYVRMVLVLAASSVVLLSRAASTQEAVFVFQGNRGPVRVHVQKNADITQQKGVDVIVNPANEALIGLAGVSAAIQDAAGPELIAELEALPVDTNGERCAISDVKMTDGYALMTKMGNRFIIHTVGPRATTSNRKQLLAATYANILRVATREFHGRLKSIAIPTISTGIFGYPKQEAAQVAVDTIADYIHNKECGKVQDIYLIVWGDDYFKTYCTLLAAKPSSKQENNSIFARISKAVADVFAAARKKILG
jgi:O-acetyl-ADP-ribose deacetylase (regulator of RNase III)